MTSSDTMPPLPTVEGMQIRLLERFPGYAITDTGIVLSCRNKKTGGYGKHWRKFTDGHSRDGGYRTVVFNFDGHQTNTPVHRFVLEAFVGPCPDGMDGLHNNGHPWDNRLCNLRWGTPKENAQDAIRHGRVKFRFSPDEVAAITAEWNATPCTTTELASKWNCSASIIDKIVRGGKQAERSGVIPNIMGKPEKSSIKGTALSGWGLQFRKARRSVGMSVSDVAKLCNVTKQAVSLWEYKTRPLQSDAILPFFAATGINPESLASGTFASVA